MRCSTNSVTRRTPSQRTIVRGNFVANEITKDRGMTGVRFDRRSARFGRFRGAPFFLVEKLHVLRPRQSDQDAHTRGGALIEKPARRHMIDAHDVDADFAHLREIALQSVAVNRDNDLQRPA